ncbi:MAG: hypothetical protein P8Z50_02835, partial [candidate division WOR-3 bacterium]
APGSGAGSEAEQMSFLRHEKIYPFLSVGLARKSIALDYFDYSDGLALEAGAGIVVFRTYDFRLVLDGRLSTSFVDLEESSGPHSILKIGINLLYKREKGGGCCLGL